MARPMKLAFYIHALAGGGAERVWSVMASRFAERGHDVTLVVDYEAEENRAFVAPGVRVVVLGGSHGQSVLRLSRFLRREKPDLAVAALAAANVKLTLAALLARCLDRVILTYHGYAETEPQLLSQIGFRAAGLLTRVTARSVAVSDGLGAYMQSRWHASAERLRRIYNPVAVRAGGATTREHLAEREPTIVAAGRFVSYKNFSGLLQAFAAMPDRATRLVLLGEGEGRAALAAEVESLGLGERVSMPGYVSDPWRVFDQARCFVLPSTSEPFGLVLVEAMARGLEVVATDCHGPREILADGLYGTLVPTGDTPALAAALSTAVAGPTDPTLRIERARSFDVPTAVDQYEALFRDVMADHARPRTLGLRWPFGRGRQPSVRLG